MPLVYADINSSVVSYYKFDETSGTAFTSATGLYNGTLLYGASFNSAGKINYSMLGDGTNDVANAGRITQMESAGALTISAWVQNSDIGSLPNDYIYGKGTLSTFFLGGLPRLYVEPNGNTNRGYWSDYSGIINNNTTFYMVTMVFNGTATGNGEKLKLYVNGVQRTLTYEGTIATATSSSTNNLSIGAQTDTGTSPNKGKIDEVVIYTRALTNQEVMDLYNNQTALIQYPFNPLVPEVQIKNISFTSRNIYNSTFYINNYSLEFNNNGTIYSTANGSIYLNNFNTSYLLNISFTNATNHFNINYSNVNLSSGSYTIIATNILNMTAPTITSPTAQNYAYNQNININWTKPTSYINTSISSYNISLLNSDLSFNKTINESNTGLSQVLNLSIIDAGSYYIKIVAKDIYNLTNENTSDVFNITSILGVRLQNNYTLNYESNFSGYVILSDGENKSFTSSSGYATLNIYPGLNQIYIEKSGYSITGANYFNFTATATAQTYNKTFQLYTNNSVYIMIKDETTFNLITENISIELTLGNITIGTYYTTNGTLFLDNLSDGEYNLDIGGVSSNYTSRQYVISVADQSSQTLTAFLSSSLSAVIFVVLDSYSSAILEDATISLYKYINGSLSLIEIKNSDITGRAQFNYIPLSKYRIIVQKTGYTNKAFDLDPILFASYDVFLDRNIAYTYTGSLEDVKIIFSPAQYYANETTNFLFIISSSTGVLNNYGVNLSYPCGNKSFTGNNSIGGLYNVSFAISCAQFRDTINITYFYESVGNPTRYYYYQYYIGGTYSASNYTFINLRKQGETFGLGALERILIVTLIALIVGGVTYLIIGGVGAVILCLLVFSYFTYTGFIPLWSVLISMFSGFFLLTGRDN
jgi:hypothetical protein